MMGGQLTLRIYTPTRGSRPRGKRMIQGAGAIILGSNLTWQRGLAQQVSNGPSTASGNYLRVSHQG